MIRTLEVEANARGHFLRAARYYLASTVSSRYSLPRKLRNTDTWIHLSLKEGPGGLEIATVGISSGLKPAGAPEDLLTSRGRKPAGFF